MDVKVFEYVLSTMEHKLEYLLKHAERTAVLCYATARELELDSEYKEIAYMSGLLHEIGKMFLSNKVKIGDQNIDIEKIYPYFSSSMVKCFEGFDDVASVIIQNAENIDGSGYPMGLEGEEVGAIARILRISDYYDTCRMNGLTHDETTKKLRENSDIIFPQKLITPFIKAVIKNELQLEYEENEKIVD